MRFEQLRYLEAALRTGSFRQAAKELGVSQPTITTQVQRLEEDLGVVLVVRGAHGVLPTDAAAQILPHAKAAIRAEDLLRQEASAIEGLKVGSVRIGTVATGNMLILPGVVKRLRDEHPNIRFEVAAGGSTMVRRGVVGGHFDLGLLIRLGLVESEEDEERLTYSDLMSGRLVLCVPEGHRLAQVETLDVAELSGEPLIFFTKGSILRTAFEKLISGIEANVVFEADGAETAQRMVQAGVGISIANSLAPSTVSGNGVVLIPLSEPWARATLSVAVRRGEARSVVVQTLLRLIRESPGS